MYYQWNDNTRLVKRREIVPDTKQIYPSEIKEEIPTNERKEGRGKN